jgi:hypothetical protein
MLAKHDIQMMSDGQREILRVGMLMERDRILRVIAEEKKLAKELNNSLLSAKLASIEVDIKGGPLV